MKRARNIGIQVKSENKPYFTLLNHLSEDKEFVDKLQGLSLELAQPDSRSLAELKTFFKALIRANKLERLVFDYFEQVIW